ncbi:MAG: F0F1 ATP synthase subunit B [Thermodesulfovibrionales bacterium]|nr:F0F1 ATP synthase subunit B [Thermodesulfovibrionales bacterium]
MMTKKSYRPAVIVPAVLIVLFAAGLAFASGGGGGEGEHGGSLLKGFLIQVLNFSILVGVLVWFARKPIREFFAGRTEAINKGIAEAREAREAAERALEEVQKKLDSSDAEIEKMIKAARESGQREREHLINEGQRMSQRIIKQAKSGIEFELNQATEGLKAEAAEYAVKLAEEKIGSKLDDAEQMKLLEDAIKRLEDRA